MSALPAPAGPPSASGGGLPRGLQVMIGLAAAVVVIGGLQASADIVGPAFLAMVLVICVHPVRAWMKTKGVPGWLASVISGLHDPRRSRAGL